MWGDWSEVSGESEEIHNETLTLTELAREESDGPHIKSEWSLISISRQTPNLPTGLSCVSPNECFNTLLPPASFCSPSAKKSEQKTHFHLIVGGLTIKSRWTILVVDSCKSLAGLCVMTRWPQIQLLQIIHLGSPIMLYWQSDTFWETRAGRDGVVRCELFFSPPCTLSLQSQPACTTLVISSHAPQQPAASTAHEYVSGPATSYTSIQQAAYSGSATPTLRATHRADYLINYEVFFRQYSNLIGDCFVNLWCSTLMQQIEIKSSKVEMLTPTYLKQLKFSSQKKVKRVNLFVKKLLH